MYPSPSTRTEVLLICVSSARPVAFLKTKVSYEEGKDWAQAGRGRLLWTSAGVGVGGMRGRGPSDLCLDLLPSPERHLHTAPGAAPSFRDWRWIFIKDHSVFPTMQRPHRGNSGRRGDALTACFCQNIVEISYFLSFTLETHGIVSSPC